MTPNQDRAVDVVAKALAIDSGWEEDTEDYDQAVDMAVVAVQALTDANLLLAVD